MKGKAEPVPLWRVVAPLIRFGAPVERDGGAAFVGRDSELGLLKEIFSSTLQEPSVRLVTVVGEPGVGKTRLVSEFANAIHIRPEPVFWRQGRCLPYGDGVTFWAFGEIVKQHAAILDSDGPQEAWGKLNAATESVADQPSDRQWMAKRLGALLGLAASEAETSERGELFTAWRRFLEGIASDRPLVLVLEDLHWADPLMLEFVVRFAESALAVPILVLGTARPELFDAHPGWPGTLRNSSTIRLSRLTDKETNLLISSLLGDTVLPPDTHSALLERCGGNPLYAQHFVRMLDDRRNLDRKETLLLDSEQDIPVPETIQALISARLDALPPLHKSLLQDAAVVGKAFWPGALAHIERTSPGEIEWRLHELTRKELAHRAPESSIVGQAEYDFSHILIKDVAYRQIPRPNRVRKHRAVAEWIVANVGERLVDHAEILAHHYAEALHLARASGLKEDSEALVGPAVQFLVLAGDRAIHLDVDRADAYYRRALDLLPRGDPMLGPVLAKMAGTADLTGRADEAERMYKEAIEELRRQGNLLGTGEALVGLADLVWAPGRFAEASSILSEAIGLLEQEPAGYGLALGYLLMSRQHWHPPRPEESLAWAEKGLAVAGQLRNDELMVRARIYLAQGLFFLGDPERGLQGLRECLRIGIALGVGHETARVYSNLGDWVGIYEGSAKGLEVLREGMAFAQSRGLTAAIVHMRNLSLGHLYNVGRWDELLTEADKVVAWARDQGDPREGAEALVSKAEVLLRLGRQVEAAALRNEFLGLARKSEDLPDLIWALRVSATIDHAAGEIHSALQDVQEIRELCKDDPSLRNDALPEAVGVLSAVGATEEARSFLEGVKPRSDREGAFLLMARAVLDEGEGDVQQAADEYAEAVGLLEKTIVLPYQADALLGEGRCLIAQQRRKEAIARLGEALDIYRQLGAQPLVSEAESWLARAS